MCVCACACMCAFCGAATPHNSNEGCTIWWCMVIKCHHDGHLDLVWGAKATTGFEITRQCCPAQKRGSFFCGPGIAALKTLRGRAKREVGPCESFRGGLFWKPQVTEKLCQRHTCFQKWGPSKLRKGMQWCGLCTAGRPMPNNYKQCP